MSEQTTQQPTPKPAAKAPAKPKAAPKPAPRKLDRRLAGVECPLCKASGSDLCKSTKTGQPMWYEHIQRWKAAGLGKDEQQAYEAKRLAAAKAAHGDGKAAS
jgi:hypothetical protein